MLIDNINDILKKYGYFIPQQRFFINNIEIHTSDKLLIKKIKGFLHPYFSTSYNCSLISDILFKTYVLSEIELIQILSLIPIGKTTYQYIGGPHKYLLWETILDGENIISVIRSSFTIVIQYPKNNHFIIISTNKIMDKMITKIIRTDIIYPELQMNGIPLVEGGSFIINSGILILYENVDKYSVFKQLVSLYGIHIISSSLCYIKLENNKPVVYGTPEKIRISKNTFKKNKNSNNFSGKIININSYDKTMSLKSEIDAKEIAHNLNCLIKPYDSLSNIIIVKRKEKNSGQSGRKLMSSEINRIIRQNLVLPQTEELPRPWNKIIDVNIHTSECIMNKIIESISKSVNGFEVYEDDIKNLKI